MGAAQVARILGLPNGNAIMACSGEAVENNVAEDLGELCVPVLLIQVGLLKSCDLFKGPGSAVLKESESTAIADLDDETELIDGTTLNNDSTIIDPMDQTAAAAKAANATKRFRRLVGLNGETCYVLITDRKSGAW